MKLSSCSLWNPVLVVLWEEGGDVWFWVLGGIFCLFIKTELQHLMDMLQCLVYCADDTNLVLFSSRCLLQDYKYLDALI